MKKIIGWLLITLGSVWAVVTIIKAPAGGPDGLGYSRLIGAVTLPVLVALLGLYLSGFIKNAK